MGEWRDRDTIKNIINSIRTVKDLKEMGLTMLGQKTGFWKAWGYYPPLGYINTNWRLDNWTPWGETISFLKFIFENYENNIVSIQYSKVDVWEYIPDDFDVCPGMKYPSSESLDTDGDSFFIDVLFKETLQYFYIEFVTPGGWEWE